MKKLFSAIILPLLFSSCNILNDGLPHGGAWVRVVNTGPAPTQGYIIEEQIKHNTIQHFFPALAPGDSSRYLHFCSFNEGGKITVATDSLALTKRMSNCTGCATNRAHRVTVCVSYTRLQADIKVDIYYGREQ